jgi:hypothetical protein
MLSTKAVMHMINLVLSVDNFGDWATPKETPTGLFYFYRYRFPKQLSSCLPLIDLPLLSNSSFSEVRIANFFAKASDACVSRFAAVIIP